MRVPPRGLVRLACAAAALVLLLPGLSDPASAQTCPDTTPNPSQPPSCTIDTAGIAALATSPQECVSVVDCPAGAACELGFCFAGCNDPGAPACGAGSYCDCVGQCVTASPEGIPCTTAGLQVEPQALSLEGPGAAHQQSFEITAAHDDLGVVVAVADEALELACFVGADPTLSVGCSCPTSATAECPADTLGRCCTFPSIPEDEARRLFVRAHPTAGASLSPLWHVNVSSGAEHAPVAVSAIDTSPPGIDGRYAGFAYIKTAAPIWTGYSFYPVLPTEAASERRVEVSAVVKETSAGSGVYRLRIDDPGRLIGADGEVIAEMTCGSTCAWRILGAGADQTSATEVPWQIAGASTAVSASDGFLRGTLRGRARNTASRNLLDGFLVAFGDWIGGSPSYGERPLIEWNLELRRLGNAPAGAIAAPPDLEPELDPREPGYEEALLDHRWDPASPVAKFADCPISVALLDQTPFDPNFGTSSYWRGCMADRTSNFDLFYDQYFAHAAQLDRGEPVACEWGRHHLEPGNQMAPIGFIPCGGRHSEYHLWLLTIGLDPPGWWTETKDYCADFAKFGCQPGYWTDARGADFAGCWMTATPDLPLPPHEPLACTQAHLCTGGKVMAGTVRPHGDDDKGAKGTYLVGDPVYNAPGDTFFVSGTLPSTGDLACGAPTWKGDYEKGTERPWGTIGFFAGKDAGIKNQQSPREMLTSCVRDLLRDDGTISDAAPLVTAGCIQKTLFLGAMGWASEATRLNTTPPKTQTITIGGKSYEPKDPFAIQPKKATPEDQAADALLLRLLTQWVEVHGFVAREGLEEIRFARALLRDPAGPSGSTAFGVASGVATSTGGPAGEAGLDTLSDEVFAALEAGWGHVLDPRFQASVALIPGQIVAQPDYRTRSWSPYPSVSGEELAKGHVADPQNLGLPATLLDGMSVYLQLVIDDIQRAGNGPGTTDHATAMDRLGKALRAAQIVESLAEQLVLRAKTHNPAWAPAYDRAKATFGATLSRAIAMGQRVGRGEDALGIDAEVLPLYFNTLQPLSSASAGSDFLMTMTVDAINAATFDLNQATNAWLAWLQHDARTREETLAAKDRVANAQHEAGRELQALCGNKTANAEDMIAWADANGDGSADVSAVECYLDDRPECQIDQAAVEGEYAATPEEDIRAWACQLGASVRAQWNGWTDVSDNDQVLFLASSLAGASVQTIATTQIDRPTPYTMTMLGRTVSMEAFFAADISRASDVDRAACAAVIGAPDVPDLETLAAEQLDTGSCYVGLVGEAAHAVRSAGQRVIVAAERAEEHIQLYELRMEGCVDLEDTNSAIQGERQAYMQEMRRLRRKRDRLHQFRNGWSWWTKGISNFFNPIGYFGNLLDMGSMVASTELAELQSDMENLKDRHDDLVQTLREEYGERQCYRGAREALIGLTTSQEQVYAAQLDAQGAALKYINAAERVDAAVSAGAWAERSLEIDPATGRRVWTPIRDLEQWYADTKTAAMDTFERKLDDARRKAYLTSLAVDWEFEISPSVVEGWRQDILAARHPEELRIVQAAMLAETVVATTAQHQRVTRVLSLCNILFTEGRNSADPACSPERRQQLRRMIGDPANAVYDEDGDYLGQTLRFTLQPTASQVANNCQERLWDVTASLQATGVLIRDLLIGRSTRSAQQSCSETTAGGDPRMVWGVVRPCQNAFLGDDPEQRVGGNCRADSVRSPLYPVPANTQVQQMLSSPYAYDVVTSFAGMGAWGDYFLHIPADSIDAALLDGLSDIYIRVTVLERSQP